MWTKSLDDVGSVISHSIPNSYFFLLSLAVFTFLLVSIFHGLGHLFSPPGSLPSSSSVPKAHNGISASRLAQVDSPQFSQSSIFFFFSPSPPLMIHGGPLKWSRRAPGLIQAFPKSPEEPTTIFLTLPPPVPWCSVVLPGGPERGQCGLVCKWEPYWRYLLFHLYLLFALESREATDI